MPRLLSHAAVCGAGVGALAWSSWSRACKHPAHSTCVIHLLCLAILPCVFLHGYIMFSRFEQDKPQSNFKKICALHFSSSHVRQSSCQQTCLWGGKAVLCILSRASIWPHRSPLSWGPSSHVTAQHKLIPQGHFCRQNLPRNFSHGYGWIAHRNGRNWKPRVFSTGDIGSVLRQSEERFFPSLWFTFLLRTIIHMAKTVQPSGKTEICSFPPPFHQGNFIGYVWAIATWLSFPNRQVCFISGPLFCSAILTQCLTTSKLPITFIFKLWNTNK